MKPEPLNATAALFRDLAEDGTLTPARSAELQRLLRALLPWRTWLERLLLMLGAGLLLAGLLFFFAYNWAAMRAWQKLGLVETAIVLCAAGAAWKGLGTLAGQIGVFAACVLVGVFLAVFGQIYQTGADTFELFLGWAALILPWVLLARFGALWLLWLLLLNLAAGFSWRQTDFWTSLNLTAFSDFTVVVALLNGIALAARELGAARGLAWLREEWLRGVPLTALFAALTIGTCWLIIDSSQHASPLAPATLTVMSGFAYAVYRWQRPSLYALAVMAFAWCVVLCTFLGRALLDHWNDIGSFFLMAMLVLAIFGGAIAWLRHESRAMETTKEAP